MKIEIKKINGDVIYECEARSVREAVVAAKADLRGADLRGADLRGANLRGANLRGADLWGACLRGTDLRDADLRDADLWDADLSDADLRCADLRDACLRGADLRGADLWGADLRGADLRDADLRGADLDFSAWPLCCGTRGVKVDVKIAAQLAAHFCAVDCEDKKYQKARKAILKFAMISHRAKDLGIREQK